MTPYLLLRVKFIRGYVVKKSLKIISVKGKELKKNMKPDSGPLS